MKQLEFNQMGHITGGQSDECAAAVGRARFLLALAIGATFLGPVGWIGVGLAATAGFTSGLTIGLNCDI